MSFFVTLSMSCVMSLAMTALNTGPTDGFLVRWLAAWLTGFIVALPAAALIIPAARALTKQLIQED